MTHTEESILNFPKQFGFNPRIENESQLQAKKKYLVAGMGGSHLAADLVQVVYPKCDIAVHSDYGLPEMPDIEERLVVAFSYSGNTEEVLGAYEEARQRGLALATISIGGELLKRARKDMMPYVVLPDTGIQPRAALGFSVLGLLKLMGWERELKELSMLASVLHPEALRQIGTSIAGTLAGKVPVVYASRANAPVAYNWKIKFNESAKIPAFYNLFPELNHNEMNGFDAIPATQELSRVFHFIFLRDEHDDPRILKRMNVLQSLYKERGLAVMVVSMEGATAWQRIFNSLLTADWAAYYLALHYGAEPEAVPMVEEFKKRIREE